MVAPPQGCCGALSVHAGRLEEGKRVRAAADRRVRPRRRHRGQFVRLRVAPERARLAPRGTRAPRSSPRRCATSASSSRTSGRVHVDTPSRCASRCRTRATSATRSGCRWYRHGLARGESLGLTSSSRQSGTSAAARLGSTTSSSRRPPASSATARRLTSSRRVPSAFASANPGCLVQVSQALHRAKRPLPALHPIELVDASIRNTGAARLLTRARR